MQQNDMLNMVKAQLIMGMHNPSTFSIWSTAEKLFSFSLISGIDKLFTILPSMIEKCRKRAQNSPTYTQIADLAPSAKAEPDTFKSSIQYRHQFNDMSNSTPHPITQVVNHILLYVSNLTNINILSYKLTQYIIAEKHIIHVEDDVYFRFQSCRDDDKTGKLDSISFELLSKHHPTKHLLQFVDKCTSQYTTMINSKYNNQLFYFDQIVVNEDEQMFNQNTRGVGFNTFTSSKFFTTRSFDNIFFHNKQMILNRINTFLHDTNFYRRIGIPHTLGFLLHGPPGNGKTSFIKALAQYTNRHVVNIRLTKNTTSTKFKNLFYNDKLMVDDPIATTPLEIAHIPVERRIYVIEDIDCGDNEVVFQRSPTNTPAQSWGDTGDFDDTPQIRAPAKPDPFGSTLIRGGALKSMDPTKKPAIQDKLDLQTILNCLDGTLEVPGRIIIATSNFPEKIDNALLRPGRFDAIIHFSRATDESIRAAIGTFHPQVDLATKHPTPFENEKWSMAELIQILCRDLANIDSALRVIDEADPREEFKFRMNAT